MPHIEQTSLQRQAFSISQATISACNVLSMSAEELYSYIQEAANENPLISFESIPHFYALGQDAAYRPARETSIDFISELDSEKSAFASSSPLVEHLRLQIPARCGAGEERIIKYLINLLDSDGYFRESARECSRLLNCTEEQTERALAVIQGMDPPGVGARDLRECLLLQLRHRRMEGSLAYGILKDHFGAIAKNQVRDVAKALNCELEQVYEALQVIRGLDSRPARQFSDQSPGYIIPDISVGRQEEGFSVQLNRELPFELQFDQSYEELLRCGDEGARLWLRDKRRQAAALRLFIQKRGQTLLLVAEEIFRQQKPFFFKGPEYLRPLRQKDIAEALSCHESTVFRAVSGKYLSCCWGTFPLSYFFSNQLDCGEGFDPCNPKLMLKKMIDAEDKRSPLSDSALAEKLLEHGVRISRRTVAKYRDEAGIPAAALRRKFT